MAGFREDTETVKREFEEVSTPTQIFIWSMVALGVLLGVVLGGAIGYGVAVDEVDGRECIEHEDTLYCAEGEEAPATEGQQQPPEGEQPPPPPPPEGEQPPPPPEGEQPPPPEGEQPPAPQ